MNLVNKEQLDNIWKKMNDYNIPLDAIKNLLNICKIWQLNNITTYYWLFIKLRINLMTTINEKLFRKSVVILDEVSYNKKLRGLRQYFMKSYKYLTFNILPSLSDPGKKDGVYSVDIPTDYFFEKCYGKLQLLFSVKNEFQ